MNTSSLNDWDLIGKTLSILQDCSAIHFFNGGKSALIVKGKVLYAYGDNHPCISSKNNECSRYFVPHQLLELENGLKAIGTGHNHAIILDERGVVSTWGDNEHGQLGDGQQYRRIQPYQVGLPTITQIACGRHCTLALDTKNEVWFWGRLSLVADTFSRIRVPKRISLNGNIGASQISCGNSFALIVTTDDKVLTWGFNDCGQLGHGHRDIVGEPREISGLTQVSAALCALSSIIFLTKDGRIFVTGRTGQSMNYDIPKEVKFSSKITAISACWKLDQFGVKTEEGYVFRWGFHDKTGIPERTEFKDIRQVYSNNCTPIVYPKDADDAGDGLIASGNTITKVEAATDEPEGNKKKANKKKNKSKSNIGETSKKDQATLKSYVNNWCDVKIKLKDGEEFMAHSAVLTRTSHYFKTLLQFEPNKCEIDLSSFEASTCRTFFKFVYTNEIGHITMDEIPTLCQLSDNIYDNDLLRKCFNTWNDALSRRTIISMFVIAFKNNFEPLKLMCMPIIWLYMKEITKSDEYKRLPNEMKIAIAAAYRKGLEIFC